MMLLKWMRTAEGTLSLGQKIATIIIGGVTLGTVALAAIHNFMQVGINTKRLETLEVTRIPAAERRISDLEIERWRGAFVDSLRYHEIMTSIDDVKGALGIKPKNKH